MQKLFLDTNIVLDFLGEREPFYYTTAQLMSLADLNQVKLATSALSFATVSYFLTKAEGIESTKQKLRQFKILSEVVSLTDIVIDKALNFKFKDFEDGLQYFSALDAKCHLIVSRNPKDFKTASLPVLSVAEYLKAYW